MLLSKNIALHRVISGTWSHFIYSVLICTATYIGYYYVNSPNWDFPVLLPTILGTALAFFIGFNNNQAYDRWWEARKIWGELVNDSRSWARQIWYYSGADANKKSPDLNDRIVKMIKRHIAFLHALRDNLRNAPLESYTSYLSESDLKEIAPQGNKHAAILNLQTKELEALYVEGIIDGFRFSELSGILTRFSDDMGKAERIKNTVFPTTYGFYTYFFIWIFIISVTVVTEEHLGVGSIIVGVLIGYVFLTSHKIGKSLINPFENIPSGVPVNQITRTIEINLLELIGDQNIPEPYPSVDGEYVM